VCLSLNPDRRGYPCCSSSQPQTNTHQHIHYSPKHDCNQIMVISNRATLGKIMGKFRENVVCFPKFSHFFLKMGEFSRNFSQCNHVTTKSSLSPIAIGFICLSPWVLSIHLLSTNIHFAIIFKWVYWKYPDIHWFVKTQFLHKHLPKQSGYFLWMS